VASDNQNPALTFEDAKAILRKLGTTPSIVLVGGQALNFWAEQFRSTVPELEKFAPYQSSDIDFLARSTDVEAAARRLGGRAVYPSPDHINTPEIGIVYCLIGGQEIKIDFLGYLIGPRRSEVERASVQAKIADGLVLQVLNPLHVLESRVGNVIELGRNDTLSLRQLQASILIAQAYVQRAIKEEVRDGLDLLEDLFEIAMSRSGLKVWRDYGVDVFAVVQPYPGLPTNFSKHRYPQMQKLLDQKRNKLRPKTV
jgi:hypothetical protein